MFIEHTSMSLVDFIDWLGTDGGREYFLFSPSFLALLGSCCMHYVYFGVPLLVFLFNLHLLIKKKKKNFQFHVRLL